MNVFHLDFETYSACDLRKWGAYRYAADPSTQILLMAVARNGEEPVLWVHPEHETDLQFTDDRVFDLLEEIAAGAIVYAHNAQFEAAITRYRWDKDIGTTPVDLSQWRCTASIARTAALPSSLGQLSEALGLAQQKDKTGSDLIKRFSIPQKPPKRKGVAPDWYRILPLEDSEGFKQFGDYCLQDVRAEQEVHHRLKDFDLKGQPLKTFMLDMRINDRGVPVNVPAAQHALTLVDDAAPLLLSRFVELTGLNPTQNVKLVEWFRERGYPFTSMAAEFVDQALEDDGWADCPATFEALELRSVLGFAALKKLDTMVACDCGDGYVRGTLRYYGAGTGRWSASLIQPQNYKRPEPEFAKVTGLAYYMICDGCSVDDLVMMFGTNVLGLVASCIRHFIQPQDGQLFLDADYAAIEARIVCWLAGQQDALDDYNRGICAYSKMAVYIYGGKYEDIKKENGMRRFVGKQAVLGCGFQMWWPAFQRQCKKFGVDVPEDVCELAVKTFRNVRDKVAKLWEQTETAAREAIRNPGKWHQAGPKLKFCVTKSAGIPFLVMRLPSGRNIVYPYPKLETVGKKPNTITFWGAVKDKHWGRVSTYGGKLVENATQGTAADVMANGACRAEEQGFQVATLIHDQALAYPPEGCADLQAALKDFTRALCYLPPWADGLPIIAEGNISPYYTKG